MPKTVCVPTEHVAQLWPRVSHFIKAAMARADLGRFADVERDVMAGKALLWIAWDDPYVECAAVTQVSTTDTKTICTLVALGGYRRERWMHCLDDIEAYAKAMGCSAVRLMGRKGWERVLKNYKAKRVILEKAI